MGTGSSSSHTESLSTAFASAYKATYFNCQAVRDAGNVVTVSGACSCIDVGITNSADCRVYTAAAQSSADYQCRLYAALVKEGKATSAEMLCACRMGGCALDVNQSSVFTDMTMCDSTNTVSQTLSATFLDNLRTEVSRVNSDLGQLLQNGQDNVYTRAVKNFTATVSDTTNTNILSSIKTGNTATVGCGATVSNLTQRAQYNAILSAVQRNTTSQAALSDMNTLAETHLAVSNKGFLGGLWDALGSLFSSPLVMIAIIVGIAIVAYIVYKKFFSNGTPTYQQPTVIYAAPPPAAPRTS